METARANGLVLCRQQLTGPGTYRYLLQVPGGPTGPAPYRYRQIPTDTCRTGTYRYLGDLPEVRVVVVELDVLALDALEELHAALGLARHLLVPVPEPRDEVLQVRCPPRLINVRVAECQRRTSRANTHPVSALHRLAPTWGNSCEHTRGLQRT